MNVPRETLRRASDAFGVPLDDTALDRLDTYAAMLVDYNSRVNLTAITDPEGIAIKHFADSLSVFGAAEIPQGARCADVGTGAGFPGVVMLIARPDLKMTLVDSTGKKLRFIQDVLDAIGLQATIVHARAEELGRDSSYREQFDFVTARAVAAMDTLCEYCLPLVRVGGTFIAMKGPDAENEMKTARAGIKILGGGEIQFSRFQLAESAERNILTVKKSSQTPPKYPRPSAQIAKRKIGS